jgi:hypothetical protein
MENLSFRARSIAIGFADHNTESSVIPTGALRLAKPIAMRSGGACCFLHPQ